MKLQKDECILVTGGAGYIGSHVVRQLREAEAPVVVLDNLSTGRRDAILDAELIVGDTSDRELVTQLLKAHRIKAVLHFAAHTVVPESVANPLKYYANNTCASRHLLECCVQCGVGQFVFSSTAAVYGMPDCERCTEGLPANPINPYGHSKLMTEQMLRDVGATGALKYIVLRYFNVAGADPGGRMGQSTPVATHLIKVACQAALGQRESIGIFGTDYPTPDGTGVRDYIHVEDLASAHLHALAHLQAGGDSTTLNCGYGSGYSVREVLNTVEQVSSKRLNIQELPRRAGDPARIVADNQRICELFNWRPRFNNLEVIVQHALAWEQQLGKDSNA